MRERREVMQQQAGATRRQEGGIMRGRQEAMQQPATRWGPNGSDWPGDSHGCSSY